MWNLEVYLLIGEHIPSDDPKWENFLLLLDILQICKSRLLSVDLVHHLKMLIKLYLTSFS